jgi:hypothetical protein
VILLAACSVAPKGERPPYGGGGGLAGNGHPADERPGFIEVRGYALAPQDQVPTNAIGYAVPIFTDMSQIQHFCPLFRSQLTFEGALDAGTPLKVRSYGNTVQIAPFIWPVTSWTSDDKPDCKLLVERYNISGARQFFAIAQQAIRASGGQPADALEHGPFIVVARRVSGSVMVFDLSRAPDGDYKLWLSRAVEQLSNPIVDTTRVVRPPWRDQVRAYVFGVMPVFTGVLEKLIPNFTKAQTG